MDSDGLVFVGAVFSSKEVNKLKQIGLDQRFLLTTSDETCFIIHLESLRPQGLVSTLETLKDKYKQELKAKLRELKVVGAKIVDGEMGCSQVESASNSHLN